MWNRTTTAAVVVVIATAAVSSPARAGVEPGDVITKANAASVKELVSPGMYWAVQHGFPMKIVETRSIPWRRVYKEATEKFSGQVSIGADGLTLENYVAGLPFPHVDPTDQRAAIKLMRNFQYGPNKYDDLDVRNFDADTGPISEEHPVRIERHFLIDHFRRLRYVGRLYVDPRPEIPNNEGFEFKETLHPLLEPFDLKGVGFTFYRYLDPAKQDDSWLYLPSLRRVRRLSTAQRSDALFGQDTDQDSYGGYNGQIAWSDWKLLGETEVLGTFHATAFPVKWAAGAANWAFDDVWEKRKVYVIEGVSKLPQYAYSKRVLFLDKEIWEVPYADMYDRAGQLWKIWINDWSFKQEPFPGSRVSYDEVTVFLPAIVMVDMQLEHATIAALPSHRFPGEPGWYHHQGDKEGTTEDQFSIAELIKSGH